MEINVDKLVQVVDALIIEANEEINEIQSQIARLVIKQVAIYAHDNINSVDGSSSTFGVLSSSPSIDKDLAEEVRSFTGELAAVLVDRETRRNSLFHLKKLLLEGNKDVTVLLTQQLSEWVDKDFPFDSILSPKEVHLSGNVKLYPYK